MEADSSASGARRTRPDHVAALPGGREGDSVAFPGRSERKAQMLVSEAVGKVLADQGVRVVFGLMGSGNLTVTNALRDAGAAFYGARHETGAVCMADGYARLSGEVAAASVHQGPGLTNA